MGMSWKSSIRDTKQLTIYNGITGGKWANIFDKSLESFNKFSKQVGVKFVPESDEEKANVIMQISSGAPSYIYGKDTFTSKKPFLSTGVHGYTMLLSVEKIIEKAVVFLPSDPQEGLGFAKGLPSTKDVSQDVMRAIAVHEFVHACGLEDSDHGGSGIFYFPLAVSSGKVYIPQKGKNMKPMPPIRLDPEIGGKIKKLW